MKTNAQTRRKPMVMDPKEMEAHLKDENAH